MAADRLVFFPLLALVLAALAWYWPEPFAAMGSAIVPLLMLVMLCMGLGLQPADFARVARQSSDVGLGLLLQFTVMPLAAVMLVHLADLPPALAAGFILLGASPGGTASNVITYLARGDVALSITLTASSTLLGVALTPLLTDVLTSAHVAVPLGAMLWSMVQLVLLPVALGMALRYFFAGRIVAWQDAFAWLAALAISLIIAIIVALNVAQLRQMGLILLMLVVAHNAIGLLAGYGAALAMGRSPWVARTLAIEVGMQNSGLAVALAKAYFVPLAAVPGAMFSVWHNISGSLLAMWWRHRLNAQERGHGNPAHD